MNKRKTRNFISAVCLIAVLLIASGTMVVFAYFSAQKSVQTENLTLTIDPESNVIKIFSAYDLKVWARDDVYNTAAEESEVAGRYMLRLENDIVLDENVLIDRDVNIALNGHTLALNGHTVTVRHTYTGRQYLTDLHDGSSAAVPGQITTENTAGAAGKIIYDTPNSLIVIDDAYRGAAEIVLPDGSGYAAALLAQIELYIQQKMLPSLAASVTEAKLYAVSDVELITHVSAYPYKIVWASADPNAITNEGKVIKLPDTGTDEVLLSYAIVGADGEQKAAGSYTVTLLANGNREARVEIARDMFAKWAKQYENPGLEGIYQLFLNIGLPYRLNYYGVTFDYETYVDGVRTEADLAWNADKSAVWLVRPGEARRIELRVTAVFNKGGANELCADPVSYTFLAVDGNNSNVSQKVLGKIGVILIETKETVLPLISAQDKAENNIAEVQYTFENNLNASTGEPYYEIGKDVLDLQTGEIRDILYVREGSVLPESEREIFLTIKIIYSVGNPKSTESKLQVYCVDSSMGGGDPSADKFLPYHAQVVERLQKETFYGTTYVTFSVPLVWQGAVKVRFYLSTDSAQPDPYRGRIRIDYDMAAGYAYFVIDATLLETVNESVQIYFKYAKLSEVPGNAQQEAVFWDGLLFYGKKLEADNVTETGAATAYTLQLNGLIKEGANIPDTNLFQALYAAFNLDDLDDRRILTADEIAKTSVTEFELSNVAVASLRGIEYFTGLKKLSLCNVGFQDADMTYVLALQSLERLSLSGNADLTSAGANQLSKLNKLVRLDLSFTAVGVGLNLGQLMGLKELSLQRTGLSDLSAIAALGALETLHVGQNDIELFSELLKFDALKEVRLYANAPTLDGYGSMGRYNSSVLTLLSQHGVAVYYDSNDTLAVWQPTAAQIEGANAVESIFYVRSVKAVNGIAIVEMPARVYIGAGQSKYYDFAWKIDGRMETGTIANDVIRFEISQITALTALRLIVSVDIKDGAGAVAATVYRVLIVEVTV